MMNTKVYQQPLEQEDDLAPLSCLFFDNKERYLDIDLGVFDYVMKCIEGPYCGKFFYINTSPHGEIIGGAPQYNQIRNPEKLTIYIENCELQSKHAAITLNSHCQYLLQDVSDPQAGNGIWIKVPTHGEGLDLYKNQNFRRNFMINKFQYQFGFQEDDQDIQEVQCLLQKNNAPFAIFLMQNEDVLTCNDFVTRVQEVIEKYELTPEDASILQNIARDLKYNMQQQNAIQNTRSISLDLKKMLLMKFEQGIQKEVLLDGENDYLISSSKNDKADIKIDDDTLEGMNLRVQFKNGSYFMCGDNQLFVDSNETPSAYFQVFKDEKYQIQPGDVLNMGLLTFAIERFNTGVIADVGLRGSMEDTYLIVQDLGIEDYLKISLYAVIDGHGGVYCAHFLRQRLEDEIRRQLNDPIEGIKRYNKGSINECVTNALKRAFSILDEEYYKQMPDEARNCGATACCVLIIGNRIFCANVGDSRAVLCRSQKAINLSFDHKTLRQDEADRIKQAGGMISCGRVMNKLAITRAFGDFEFKIAEGNQRKNYITAEPEVRLLEMDPFIDDFIVIGSDGLYDKFSSQEVVTFIRAKLGQMPFMEQDLCKVAREIANESIYCKHVRDNVTVIIIGLNRGVK